MYCIVLYCSGKLIYPFPEVVSYVIFLNFCVILARAVDIYNQVSLCETTLIERCPSQLLER